MAHIARVRSLVALNLAFALFGLSIIRPVSVLAAEADTERFFLREGDTVPAFVVQYFAHNGPSIQEFVDGKAKVSAVVSRVVSSGFAPKVATLRIGIAPKAMSGGDVVVTGGNLYVSASTAREAAIERGLLNFFSVTLYAGGVTYFAHNGSTISQFLVGKAGVESVIARFAQNGLPLRLPSGMSIGIAPREMNGGKIVEEGGRIYLTFDVPSEDLERYLMRFVRETE